MAAAAGVPAAGSTGRGEANLENCSSVLIVEWMGQGKSPEEACLIGDAVSDVYACREVGVRSIAVAWGHQSAARLTAAGADDVVGSPRELAELLKRI